jgi:hypothetical protein
VLCGVKGLCLLLFESAGTIFAFRPRKRLHCETLMILLEVVRLWDSAKLW